METECNEGKLIFHDLNSREVVGRFDGGEFTWDAGAVLLREEVKGREPVGQVRAGLDAVIFRARAGSTGGSDTAHQRAVPVRTSRTLHVPGDTT